MNVENLKCARLKKGYTQKSAAKSLGIGISTYCNYEQGTREPNNDLLVKIADLYDVTTDYLLGRKPKEHSDPVEELSSIEAEQSLLKKYFKLDTKQRESFINALVELIQGSVPINGIVVEQKAGDIEDKFIDEIAKNAEEKLLSGE